MESRPLVVAVVDPDGLPLADASVTPVGMRSKEEPGSCYGWGLRTVPGIRGGVTDSAGRVTISFPARCRDELTTGTVIVRVEHAEACSAQVELNVDAPHPICLVRGTRLSVSAEAPPGIRFDELFADMEHDDRQVGSLKWKRETLGETLSTFLPDGKYLVRLVGVTTDKQIYFSPPQIFSVAKSSHEAGLQLTASLREGCSVSGCIDPSVPRPISKGWVVAHVTSPRRVENACSVLMNHWQVSIDVDENGSFVLPNLPEGTLEIIAGCDGYVSAELGEHRVDGIRRAQVVQANSVTPLVVPMERTGDARITVLRPDGRPLPDATVNLCPNQSLGRCTSIMGTRFDSLNVLRARGSEESLKAYQESRKFPPFWGKTDADGAVVIRGIPSGIQRFYVSSADFDLPILEDHRPLLRGEIRVPRREGAIAIRPGAKTSVEVRLEPKGSTSLSAAIASARQNRRRCG